MINEDQLCLDWFQESGFEYVYGPNIAFDGESVNTGSDQAK